MSMKFVKFIATCKCGQCKKFKVCSQTVRLCVASTHARSRLRQSCNAESITIVPSLHDSNTKIFNITDLYFVHHFLHASPISYNRRNSDLGCRGPQCSIYEVSGVPKVSRGFGWRSWGGSTGLRLDLLADSGSLTTYPTICGMYCTRFHSHSASYTGSRPWCGGACLAGRPPICASSAMCLRTLRSSVGLSTFIRLQG